jgi:UMF1 family MFS transporter|tara:strand:- start:2021 stop:3133 length:1113 start_codon:yes stop_codon:yes gene_type:complete
MGGTDGTLGYLMATSMAALFFLAPLSGAVSDAYGTRMPFLLCVTSICLVSTFLIGEFGYLVSLMLFGCSVISSQLAVIFYNGNLEDISSSKDVGRIGGLGVGIGYFGAILAVVISLVFLDSNGELLVFKIMAGSMFLFNLPLMFIGRYKRAIISDLSFFNICHNAFFDAIKTISASRDDRNWIRFLIARFWYFWAANTAATFAIIYAIQTVGLSKTEVQYVLLLGILFGIPSGIIWGLIVDKVGAFPVLKINVTGWLFILVAGLLIPLMKLPTYSWWPVGIASGIFMAGLYVSERPFILQKAPANKVGQYFAMYSMVSRASAIFGPFTWGLISHTLTLGQITAVFSLVLCAGIALIILLKPSDRVVQNSC